MVFKMNAPRPWATISLALALSSPSAAASESAIDIGGGNNFNPTIPPPSLSIDQLRSETNPVDLHRLLYDSSGIVRIAVDDDRDLRGLRKRAFGHLCDCPTFRTAGDDAFDQAWNSHPSDLEQVMLPDGTVRRTLASAAAGFAGENALKLPSWVKEDCGQDAYDSFEELRRVVADVARGFVEKLDREMEDRSFEQILTDVTHLEHFHLYTKTEAGNAISESEGRATIRQGKEAVPTLDYHTDDGFFLAFVPAMSCHSGETDNSSFYLKGQKEPLTFQEDEVVILMGAGAQYGLSPSIQNKDDKLPERLPFRAASHALRLMPDTHRAWYGKMYKLPHSLAAGMTHGDGANSPPLALTRVRLLNTEADGPADCDNTTSFFCWYRCMDIPDHDQVEMHFAEGRSLYCLDPEILASSAQSVPDATEPCEGGFAHVPACEGGWVETDAGVPGYDLMQGSHGEEEDKDGETADLPAGAGDDVEEPDDSSAMKSGAVLGFGMFGLVILYTGELFV